MSISIESGIDMLGIAFGVSIGFAVFLPMMQSLQSNLRRGGQ